MPSVSLIISESNTCDTSHAHTIKRLCGIDYPLSHFKGHIVDHLGNPIPRRKSLRIGSGVVYLLGH